MTAHAKVKWVEMNVSFAPAAEPAQLGRVGKSRPYVSLNSNGIDLETS